MSDPNHQREPLFAEDEVFATNFNPRWSPDELLAKKCIFYLTDVANCLGIQAETLEKSAFDLKTAGRDPWREMGARFVFDAWILRMTTFSAYWKRAQAQHHDFPALSRKAG